MAFPALPGPRQDWSTWGAAVHSALTRTFSVKDYGAVGNGTTDDTAALNAAMNAARLSNGRRGGHVIIPAGRYLVSAPINLYGGVSITGEGNWSADTAFYNTSAIVAAPGFVGSAILKQNPDGDTVSDPVLRPDRSWHWGRIERLAIVGNGITGPHGIDPGWNGEASSIENVQIWGCNSGIYLNDVQASANFQAISTFLCNIGVNCDNINSTVRIFGLSGDNNTNLLRVKGGSSTNVTVVGMKAENYDTGTGDPVVFLEDLTGGCVTILGGWCDTSATRTSMFRIAQPGGSTIRPRLILQGVSGNGLYTNLLVDTLDSRTLPHVGSADHPALFYNVRLLTAGDGGVNVGYARALNGTAFGDAVVYPMVTAGPSNDTWVHAGYGANGKLVSSDGAATALQWSPAGTGLGFFGATPVTKPTGVPVTVAGIHAALVSLGLIAA